MNKISSITKLFGFTSLRQVDRRACRKKIKADGTAASYVGVLWKTFVCALFAVAAAVAAIFIVKGVGLQEILVGFVNITVALIVLVIPLAILGCVMVRAPKAAVVLSPLFSAFSGALLGLVAGLVDRVVSGIIPVVIVTTMTVFFATMLFEWLLKGKIKNGFLRYLLLLLINFVLVEIIMFCVSVIIPDCELLFDPSNTLMAIQLIAAFILTFISVSVVRANIAVLNRILGRNIAEVQAVERPDQNNTDLMFGSETQIGPETLKEEFIPKSYEWTLAGGLVESLLALFIVVFLIIGVFVLLFGWIFKAGKK